MSLRNAKASSAAMKYGICTSPSGRDSASGNPMTPLSMASFSSLLLKTRRTVTPNVHPGELVVGVYHSHEDDGVEPLVVVVQ